MKIRHEVNFTDGETFKTEKNLSFQLTKVPIDSLMSTLNPKEAENEIDDFFVQELANSLLDSSIQITPIIIAPFRDTDKYLIIDGENRVRALKKNSEDEVIAVVINGLTENSVKMYRILTRRHKAVNPKACVREIQAFMHLTDDFNISDLEKIIGLAEGDYYLFDKLQSNLKYRSILRELTNGVITTQTAVKKMKLKDKRKEKEEKEEPNLITKNAKSKFIENELSGKGLPKAFDGNVKKEMLMKKVLKRNDQCFCCGRKSSKMALHLIIPEDAKGKYILNNVVPLCIECKAKVDGYSLNEKLEREYSVNINEILDNLTKNVMLLADLTTECRKSNLLALKDINEVLYGQVISGVKPYLKAVKKLKNVKSVLPDNVSPYDYVLSKRQSD